MLIEEVAPDGPAEKGGAGEMTAAKFQLWAGRSLWGMILRDDLMALDYLASRPEVDAARLGVLDQSPISQGSTGGDALRNSVDLARRADADALVFGERALRPPGALLVAQSAARGAFGRRRILRGGLLRRGGGGQKQEQRSGE